MQYEISTIQQISDLTPEQQKDFLVDFSLWLKVNNHVKEMSRNGFPFSAVTDKIIWNDDGHTGKIKEIKINTR